ncbi:MAG: hydrogenase small subunit [Proteobacteria bacterium]|nr:hydrogenase small subunit [Pseudomonadota bacterium]MBU1686851.1 hydrogenase small subunit [Pseudomonadota bacterium]
MVDRRTFLKLAASLCTTFGVGSLPAPVLAALKKITPGAVPKLIYLQGMSCTGCSISLLQADSPSPLSLITDYSQLAFHADLSAISGKKALNLLEKYINGDAGEYFLAVEGAIPEKMPEACVIGNKTFAEHLEAAAKTMSGAIAIGACACDGGIPAAEGNLTGAIGLKDFYEKRGINKLVINIRGCSVHPDWVWHTIIHLVKIGVPELINDAPALFFSRKVHELCPRYHDFQQEIFAKKLGEKGCLFKLGCLGPDTHADCPTRWWNGGQTWCIDSNAPCIGCASPTFARKKDFPFYRISEQGHQPV